ncbi:hypothetical protein HDU76_010372, partial [Blyttiomyces sp. JEL0837]
MENRPNTEESNILIPVPPHTISLYEDGLKDHEFRTSKFPKVKRFWIYQTEPVNALTHILEVGPVKLPETLTSPCTIPTRLNCDCPLPCSVKTPTAPSLPKKRILSWNVDGLKSVAKKLYDLNKDKRPASGEVLASYISNLLDTLNHAVVCVQETRIGKKNEAFYQALQQFPNWHCSITDPRTGRAGVAIFHHKFLQATYEPGMEITETLDLEKSTHKTENFDLEGRIGTLYIDNLAIINAYVPNGTRRIERQTYKELFLTNLDAHCNKLRKTHFVILAADLNIAPTEWDLAANPKDYEQTSGFLPREREWFKNIATNSFHDTYRATHPLKDSPDKQGFTWVHSDKKLSFAFWRVDHILIDNRINVHSANFSLDWSPPCSDHARLSINIPNTLSDIPEVSADTPNVAENFVNETEVSLS